MGSVYLGLKRYCLILAGMLFVALLTVTPAAALEWSVQTVDSVGRVGEYTSLALDSNGYPHISYHNSTTLKYAAWDGSVWTNRTVDSTGDVGEYTSLALNSSGYPSISYRDVTNDDLKYAAWNGTAWTNQTIDSSGSVGTYTSLALDNNGYPRISYHDTTNGDLKYAAWDGAAWTVQTVDSVNTVGAHSSLALNSSGYPRISYYDGTNGNLKYAVWSGTAWTKQTIDSVDSEGTYTSLALDGSDNPRISFFDTTNGDLKYAAWSGTAWIIQTVDSSGSVGTYTSLALDSSSNPRISYYDTTNKALKYAVWGGTAWITQTVDSTGDVGGYSSLALDSSDSPRISYYDTTNLDLKYAKGVAVNTSFTAAPASGSLPLAVSFSDTSTGSPTAWTWYFGDGGVSASQNPVHTYTTAGTYTVYLTARDSFTSNTTVHVGYINVTDSGSSAVVSGFNGTPTIGTAPLTVTFNDTSTNTPTSWNWNFGSWSAADGGVSTTRNSSHTYASAGKYTVTLNAQNANGGDTYTRIGYINVTDSGLPTVVSGFTGAPRSGTSPLTVTFTDTSTNTPTSWNWNFGSWSAADGGVSTVQNPSHTYASAGTYTVSLNAQNANLGDTHTRTGYITVTDSNPSAVVSGFTGVPMSGDAPLAVTFTDTSTNTPTSWKWNFGSWSAADDGVSMVQNPSHTYASAGTYTVSLNAQNANGGDTYTRTGYINVTDSNPSAVVSGFNGTPTSGAAPLTVTFNDTSTNIPTKWNWNFGSWSAADGGVSTARNSSHTYASAGTYTVTLNAQNANGGDTYTRTGYITVTDSDPSEVVASFIGTPTSGTAPQTVTFTDTSTNSPTSWNWSFGDGSLENSTARNPVHTYASTGIFTVTLNATNHAGSDLFTRTNYITFISSTPISTVGVFRSGVFYLKDSNSAGNADNTFPYGADTDIPITGDWTGKGYDTIGVFRTGTFYLKNNNSAGNADNTFAYGAATDKPLVGHWTTDQSGDNVGIFRRGTFYLKNNNSAGIADNVFTYGAASDVPIIGDWTGKGYDTIGVFRTGMFYLRNSNTAGNADNVFSYGSAGDIPVVWRHDGKDTVGIFRSGTFYLRESNSAGNADTVFTYGAASDTPIEGTWI